RVAIVQLKLVFRISGQDFAQLLQSPLCCRMLGRIEMNQTSRSDFQGDKHIDDAKGGGYGGEEIATHDCLGVIFQESRPALVSRFNQIIGAYQISSCKCSLRFEDRWFAIRSRVYARLLQLFG